MPPKSFRNNLDIHLVFFFPLPQYIFLPMFFKLTVAQIARDDVYLYASNPVKNETFTMNSTHILHPRALRDLNISNEVFDIYQT